MTSYMLAFQKNRLIKAHALFTFFYKFNVCERFCMAHFYTRLDHFGIEVSRFVSVDLCFLLFGFLNLLFQNIILKFLWGIFDNNELIVSNCTFIHPIEKTLSDEKHKSLTMRPNGALGSVNSCLFS